MFDVYRAKRALSGRLAEGDQLVAVAVDDVTKKPWVLTSGELIVLSEGAIEVRISLDQLAGTVTESSTIVDVRVRDAAGEVWLGAFKRRNKLTSHLEQLLGGGGTQPG